MLWSLLYGASIPSGDIVDYLPAEQLSDCVARQTRVITEIVPLVQSHHHLKRTCSGDPWAVGWHRL